MLELADYLENLEDPRTFDMSCYVEQNKCGTTACVAGHAIMLFGDEKQRAEMSTRGVDGLTFYPFRVAQEMLELTNAEAIRLFAPGTWRTLRQPYAASARQAAAEVRAVLAAST